MLIKDSNIILPETLQLLERLQADAHLKDFFLVGGTALALQLGHRFSIDLDLFIIESFDTQMLEPLMVNRYDMFIDYVAPNTIRGSIKGVKIDLIRHSYPLVQPLIVQDEIRLASIEDIAAMKLNAIAHSGQRMKDFVDVYFILEHLSLDSMLRAYEIKYANSNPMIPLKALTYFDDIDPNADSPIMVKVVSFKEIQSRLLASVSRPGKLFNS